MAAERYMNQTFSQLQQANQRPIFGYEDLQLLPLKETLKEVIPVIRQIMHYVEVATEKCQRDSSLLTHDESAAIYLYSMASPIFSHLNTALRAENRETLKPWFAFLRLFITALEKLPSIQETVWRGINFDDSLTFVDDDAHIWWSVNSCSKSPGIVQPFLGDKGTLFAISAMNGKDISEFSANCFEAEVVLMPGTRVRRRYESLSLFDRIIVLHLEEVIFPSDTQLKLNYLFEIVKQNYLQHSRIDRLINPAKSFPIEQSYINLAIVAVKEQYKKEQQLQSGQHHSSILGSYEEIYGTKTTIQVKDIFQSCERETKQVLVFGRAGVGKSTLSRYIAYQWAKGACWSQYELLALIPLRCLTTNRYRPLAPGQNYSLLDLVKKETIPYELSEKENSLLRQQFDAKKTLWILDGYDEIIQSIPAHLEHLLEQLLRTPHHIVTSRPYLNTLSYEVQMEITGFTDENIVQYVHQFFNQMKEELDDATIKNDALIKFLKSNYSIWGVAHIPVNLELICSLCSNQDWSGTAQLSITSLYRMMTEWLCRRYLTTPHHRSLQLSEDEIHECCRDELAFLENLAFSAMKNNTTIIRSSVLKKALKTNVNRADRSHVLNIGILKSFTKQGIGTQIEMDKDYYFVHLSFQEYFAARHLVNLLQGPLPEATVSFLQYEKYNQRYALVFTFMAGLLSEKEETACLDTFWKHITEEPIDLVGLRHIELIITCLAETSAESPFGQRHQLLQSLAKYIEHSVRTKNKTILQHLAQTLRKTQAIINEEAMIDMLISLLQDKEKDVKVEVLNLMCLLHIPNAPNCLIASISGLLTDNDSNVRLYACEAIRTIGEKAVTAEVSNRLIRLLTDKESRIRNSACYTLREMGEKVATPQLISKLVRDFGSENPNVTMNARCILDNLVEKTMTTEMISILVNALQNQNMYIRHSTYDVLLKVAHKLATTETIAKLSDLLEDERDDIRQNTCHILGMMGETAATADVTNRLVTKALLDKSFGVRLLACCTLGQMSGEVLSTEALTQLLNALRNRNADMRDKACFALGHIGQKVATPELISALKNATKDENEHVRASACEALVRMREKVTTSEVVNMLSTAFGDDNENVRASACGAARSMVYRSATDEMLIKLRNALEDKSLHVRHNACRSLQSIGAVAATKEIIDALVKLLDNENEEIRVNACQAIAYLGEKALTTEVIRKLLSLFEDESARVRASACGTLSQTQDTVVMDEVLRKIVSAVEDQSACVRQLACSVLWQWSKTKSISGPIDNLVRTLGDESEGVRFFACSALQSLSKQRPASEMINKLLDVLKDDNVHAREAVYFLLGDMGEKAATTEVIDGLMNELDNRNSPVRVRACWYLYQVGEKILTAEMIEKMVTVLVGKKRGVSTDACLILQQISAKVTTSNAISKLIVPLIGDDLNVSRDVAEVIGKNLNSPELISQLGPRKVSQICSSKFGSECMKNVSEEQLIELFSTYELSHWLPTITKLALVRETAITVSEDTVVVYGRKGPSKWTISQSGRQQLIKAFGDQRKELHLFF